MLYVIILITYDYLIDVLITIPKLMFYRVFFKFNLHGNKVSNTNIFISRLNLMYIIFDLLNSFSMIMTLNFD